MIPVLVFLVILSVLVLLHELGHFFVARACGVKADEFGIGFPPRAIGFVRVGKHWKVVGAKDRKNYANTIWSLNWLPLGGFVRLKGESSEDGHDHDSLLSKNGWQKFAILAAGVTMNWLFTAVVFSIGFMVGVPAVLEDLPASAIISQPRVQIMGVLPGTAADKAGIKSGDIILELNGQAASQADATRKVMQDAQGEIALSLRRGTETLDVKAMPEFLKEINRPGLGVSLADTGIVRFPAWLAVGEGVAITGRYTWLVMSGFGSLIRNLVLGAPSGDISGPIGIAVMTGGIVAQGSWALIQFAAILSINLAVINFLPIPALDGGRAVFVIAEAVRRKKNNPRFEARVHQFGFFALMLVVVLVTLQDLRKLFFP